MKKDDPMPIIRIEGDNGIAYYPLFVKNAQGEWELADKSFQTLFKQHAVIEKPAAETSED